MLCYDEYGSKGNPTILLLHGAGALDTFCRQYCFSDKYHLVVPHLAGAGLCAKMMHWRWLVLLQGKYWHYTKEQANNMSEYSKQITPQVYRSFFANTLDLSKLSEYQAVTIPMLAICGSKEVKDMKASLKLLAQNPNCQTITLQGVNHDFPMRNARQLNPILKQFILECL